MNYVFEFPLQTEAPLSPAEQASLAALCSTIVAGELLSVHRLLQAGSDLLDPVETGWAHKLAPCFTLLHQAIDAGDDATLGHLRN